MKCNQCPTYKNADNCQKCFSKLHTDYWLFINKLWEMTGIIHISTLTKIIKELKEKKEMIRNFPLNDYPVKKADKVKVK